MSLSSDKMVINGNTLGHDNGPFSSAKGDEVLLSMWCNFQFASCHLVSLKKVELLWTRYWLPSQSELMRVRVHRCHAITIRMSHLIWAEDGSVMMI